MLGFEKFKVDDWVYVTKDYCGFPIANKVGKVIMGGTETIAVDFITDFAGGHSCNGGTTTPHSGLYVDTDNRRVIKINI